MNDTEIRLACINAAVATVGNPNHVQQAREYYAFVMEGAQSAPEAVETSEDTTFDEADIQPLRSTRKGTRK